MIQITALMENELSGNRALRYGHGLSFLVERERERILFDCGPGDAMWYNAHRLGKDLSDLSGVVLSHSHYDHGAGYRDFLEMGGSRCTLYVGPCFFERKFAKKGVCFTDLSAGFDEDFLKKFKISRNVCRGVTELGTGMWLVGTFPRKWEFEKIPSRFVRLTGEGMLPDDFADEICLVLDTRKGLVLVVGCSHPGILNMTDHIRRILGKPIYGIFGGIHLKEADGERVCLTMEHLKAAGVKVLGMNHCSGSLAEEWIAKASGVEGCHMAVGDCVFFEE